MPRSVCRTALVVCALGLPGVVALLAQTGTLPQFRGGAALVTVDAYPQQNGRIVEGLTAADFEVLEDGKPQTVENLEFVRIEPAPPDAFRRDPNTVGEMRALAADPHARVFVAFLDQLHTTIEGAHNINQPLIDTLRRLVGADDLFGVMTQNMRPQQLTLGRALTSIEEQLTKYWPWGERQRIGRDFTDPVEDNLHSCFHEYTPDGQHWLPWMVDEGPVKRYFDDILIERRREDRTLTALEDLVRFVPTMRDARTVVLAISDGWMVFSSAEALLKEPDKDFRTKTEGRSLPPLAGASDTTQFRGCLFELERLARMDDQRRFRDLLTASNAANVTFYPISTIGLTTFDSSLSEHVYANGDTSSGTPLSRDMGRVTQRASALRTMAENTDGLAVVQTNDLNAGLRRVVDDMSAYYLLGYYSTNTKNDGRFRRIQVRMKRPGMAIRARRGYLAPSDSTDRARSAATATPPAPTAVPADVEAALGGLAKTSASADISTYWVVAGDELRLVVEIAPARAATTRWSQGADLHAIVTGPNGERVGNADARLEPSSRGAILSVPIAAATSGPWRVAVSATSGGESIDDRVSIEHSASGPLIGAPILYRAAPGPRSPIHPVADFQFRRTERVHVEWPLLKAIDARQARLLSRTGQPLAVAVNVTETPASLIGASGAPPPLARAPALEDSLSSRGPQAPAVNALATLSADVNLAPLGPGEYLIEVTVGSAGATERRLIAIRVVQ